MNYINIKSQSQKFRNTHTKTPAPESFCNNFAGPQACNFIKKRRQRPYPPPSPSLADPSHTAKSPRIPTLKNTFERLPLIIDTWSIPFLSKILRKLSQSLKKDYYHLWILLLSGSWYQPLQIWQFRCSLLTALLR